MANQIQSWDPIWEKIFTSQPWGKYPEIELVKFVARNYYKSLDRSKVRILDLGCGPGANTWYIAREGFDTYAIDGSEEAIKLLNERMSKENLRCHSYVGDVVELPFAENFFDAVVEVECIYSNTLSNIQKIISQVHRVLKPKGKFYSQFFGKGTLGFGTGEKIEEGTYKNVTIGEMNGMGLIHFTDSSEIKKLFSMFKEIKVERVDRTINNQNDLVQEYIIIAIK